MKLSILILTVPARAQLLATLMKELERQIASCNAFDQVEILVGPGEGAVGQKRNKLLDAAAGEFVCFIDDDDWISEDYIHQILFAIKLEPSRQFDVFGFRAVMSVGGGSPRQVIYSLQNDAQVEVGGIYYRLPCHITPIRRSCLKDVRFGEKNLGEDADFASTLYREKRLKREYFIDKVLYHYRFDSTSSLTQAGRNPPAPQGQDVSRYDIVILSQQPDNLRGCLESIFENEPALPRDRIIVVDDGSRAYCEAEYPGITWVAGQKPFIFARNANLGVNRAPAGVILLNDDARLESRYGFSSLAWSSLSCQEFGIVSASINGFVGNENQKPYSRRPFMRCEYEKAVAFIAVWIPRSTISIVGLLDERFTQYGFDDNDYCRRVRMASMGVGIYDGCVVEHNSKDNKSTYRVKAEIGMMLEQNRKIYEEKWKVQK